MADTDFADLEIRILEQAERGYPVEITLNAQQEFARGYLPFSIVPWLPGGDPVADGQRLFETLLADPAVHEAWATARGQAPRRRVRFRLDTGAAELHAFPWELLHDGRAFIAADADTPFSRYLPIAEPWGGEITARPIRMLIAIANPDDLEDKFDLPQVDVSLEEEVLQEALSEIGAAELQAVFLDAPITLERLEAELRKGYQLLHILAHGAFNPRREQAALYLQDEDGHARRVIDEDFAAMLARQGVQPHLVFLGACQSAARATADALRGLAPRLVTAGVPAVIAMQQAVTVKSARKFSAAFYQQLLDHGQVDRAANEARSSLLTAGRPDAGVPVLFMRLRSGQVWDATASAAIRSGLPAIPPPPEPAPLPDVSGFVGRDNELAYFGAKLTTGHFAVITGMPGVGKTWLAARLCVDAPEDRKIFWHKLEPDEDAYTVLWQLAAFLARQGQIDLWHMLQSVRQTGGHLPPLTVLFDYLLQLLGGRGYWLCLDSFEHGEDDVRVMQLGERLRQAAERGDLTLLLTTQRLPSFVKSGEFDTLTGFGLEDTCRLLARHGLLVSPVLARQARIFDSTASMNVPKLFAPDIAANLHVRTEGNALFLSLAMDAFTHARNPARFLARLFTEDNIERALGESIDSRLDDVQRAVLSAVAVLRGYPATRDVIDALVEVENMRDVLSELSKRQLLMVSECEREREYRLHTLMRAYYYDAMDRAKRTALHQRAGQYYETQEPDPLRAALHFQAAGEAEHAAQIAAAEVGAILNRGQAQPLLRVLRRFKSNQVPPLTWAALKIALGQIYALQGDAAARAAYESALVRLEGLPAQSARTQWIARACLGLGEWLQYDIPREALNWLQRGLREVRAQPAADLQTEEAALLIRLGAVQIGLGEYAAAQQAIQEGLALLPVGPSQLRVRALNNLGNIYSLSGSGDSVAIYQLALEMSRQLHDTLEALTIQGNLGIEKQTSGDWNGAEADYREALGRAREVGSVERQVSMNHQLGVLYTRRGNAGLAMAYFQRALELARAHELQEYEAYTLSSEADMHVRVADWAAAEPAAHGAEKQARQLDLKYPLPEIYGSWAQICLARSQIAGARAYADKAVQSAKELGLRYEEGSALRVLGRVQHQSNQLPAALASFEQSSALLSGRDPYELARTQAAWGSALMSNNLDVERGKALLQEARATFERLGAQRDLAEIKEV